jgi:hypothetical protein
MASAVGDGGLQTGRRRGSTGDAGDVCASADLFAVPVDVAVEVDNVGSATEGFIQVHAVCASAENVRRLETRARQR